MNDAIRKRLLDALRACETILGFLEDRDFREYEQNIMFRSAVERQLEIVGEALGKAAEQDDSVEDRIPSLPRIVALRNRVIHGYDTVDDEVIWTIVQNHVPELESRLGDLLDR
jgi:uncharacterized protein with HEPN domain